MEPEIQKFLTFSHLLYFKKDSITMVTNYNHYATFVIFFLVLKHKFSFNVLVSCTWDAHFSPAFQGWNILTANEVNLFQQEINLLYLITLLLHVVLQLVIEGR